MRIRRNPPNQNPISTIPLQTFLQSLGGQGRMDFALQQSAPDLLAACKRLMQSVDNGEVYIPCSIGIQISAAIAKAERI